jgi:hypothetical protein
MIVVRTLYKKGILGPEASLAETRMSVKGEWKRESENESLVVRKEACKEMK